MPFVGGTALTAQIAEAEKTFFLRQSISRQLAPGLLWSEFSAPGQPDDVTALVPHAVWLVQRWNTRTRQANLYALGGPAFYRGGGRSFEGGWFSAQADAESRRWYGMTKTAVWSAPGNFTRREYAARAGWAPWLAGFNDLNTWFMLEAGYKPAAARTTTLRPLVRFYTRTVLVELGSSLQGDPFLNLSFEF
ncbi:MAG: hypothetical protein RLZZ129_341 [Verrucomicrobiota bacterium]